MSAKRDGKSGMTAIVVALIALAGTVITVGADVYQSNRKPNEPDEPVPPVGAAPQQDVPGRGCLQAGAQQICWGKMELGSDGSHTRTFAFKFAKPFAVPPVVTNAVNTNSSGYAFAVYSYDLTEVRYSGRVVEIKFRANQAPVEFSYIAIGTPGEG